jgi:hypothetical protein
MDFVTFDNIMLTIFFLLALGFAADMVRRLK